MNNCSKSNFGGELIEHPGTNTEPDGWGKHEEAMLPEVSSRFGVHGKYV